MATFGTDKEATILSSHVVATFDQAMINNWSHQQSAIQERLAVMLNDIGAPYNQVSLPEVLTPGQIDF